MRILVVEDDESIRNALEDILEFEDYTVHAEPDGLRALEWLRVNPRPSVILLDLMMPGMNGICFRREQLKDPEIASIPVVVLTAATLDSYDNGLAFHKVLHKPLSLDALTEALRNIPIESDSRTTEITRPIVRDEKEN